MSMRSLSEKELEYEQLTDLVSGEIDRQLKERNDVLDSMKTQMSKVLKEFEDLTWHVQAKRSWMKSIGKISRDIQLTNPAAVAIHPLTTNGAIGGNATSPSKLPKLSGLKARKKIHQQLHRNVSGTLPPAEGVVSDARGVEGKIIFDKKLPRVANMEKRTDVLQSMLATQQKQMMYDRALVRYPQCRSNVFVPSIYDDLDTSSLNGDTPSLPAQPAPMTSLEMEFVYGFHNGSPSTATLSHTNTASSNASVSGNLIYLASGELLWFTASLVVLYTKETNGQRHFREHTNEVTSVALHPNKNVVASGQAGRETFVLVWDSNDDPLGKQFACLKGHSVAVRSISFSHDGKLVASLGGDMYNTICVHDWREQTLLVSARGHSFRVHTIAFNPYQAYGRPETKHAKKPGQALQDDDVCYTLVSCGVRHIRFWTLSKTEYVSPSTEESEESAFFGSAFGGPTRLRPPTPHDKIWKLEGNVPPFNGRLDVQDFTCLTFVDDSPPIYVYDEDSKELVATSARDHSFGRIVAGTAKGDLCVFWQPRRSPEIDDVLEKNIHKEPAKWWEIPDEYTDTEINELILEKILYEPTAKLVEVVPHDQETGTRYKIPKQARMEIEGIQKRLDVKPNSTALHARLAELRYNGPYAHQSSTFQVAFCKKNNLIASSGADGRIILWRCQMTQPVRVPGVSTQGIFTPLNGTFSEGSHILTPFDDGAKVFQLPAALPDNNGSSAAGSVPRPTSIAWYDDGKTIVVGTSSNSIWELNVVTGDWKLIFEARSGSMVACVTHPSKDELVSVSHDGYLTQWDIRRRTCRRRLHIGGSVGTNTSKATCMDIHPFGDEVVICMSSGELVVVSYQEFRVLKRKSMKPHVGASLNDAPPQSSLPVVAQLKFCPTGDLLAVGAKDTFIYIYHASQGYKRLHVCEGHSSTVTQLTWSADGETLMSNAADGEVLYWSISPAKGIAKQITDGFQVRDTQWIKWTCVFGWATSGIWPPDSTSLTDIAVVATSGPRRSRISADTSDNYDTAGDTDEDILAVANRNTLRLYLWPTTRGSKASTYHAHSSLITSVCFSFNDQYIFTTGGDDGALIQWRCTRSPETTSPTSVTKKKQRFRVQTQDDGDFFMTSPQRSPARPPIAEKNQATQPSPRHVRRQYREAQQDRDDVVDSAAEISEPVANRHTSRIDTHEVISHCRAKHDFIAENPDELSLKEGELIRVLSKDSGDWWLGESCDGSRGIFPSAFVTEINDMGETQADRQEHAAKTAVESNEETPTPSEAPE